MTTTEQARKVSSRIWAAGYCDESATIDALVAENERLTTALAERDAEIERLKKSEAAWVAANCGTGWINELRDHAKLYLAQRRVLEQALEALNDYQEHIYRQKTKQAITAIQEVL